MNQEHAFSDLSEEGAVAVITAIAEAKGLPVRIITRARIIELCAETLGGIEQDYWDQLIDLTLAKLDEADELNPDDPDTMIDTMQCVAADQKLPTIW